MSRSEFFKTNRRGLRAGLSTYRPVALTAAVSIAAALGAGCSKPAETNATNATHAAANASSQAPSVSASDAPAPSPDLKRTNLMHSVFPDWRDTKKGNARIVDVEVPNRDGQGHLSKEIVGSQLDVTPREVIRLDDTHAVMLTEGVEVTGTGERIDSHASGAWLGAYFFRKQPSGWVLDQRVDGVSYDGVQGTYGATDVARMSPNEFGFWTTAGSCWQGSCGSWASVFRIAPGRIERVADTLRVSASDLGARDDCEGILKHSDVPASGTDARVKALAPAKEASVSADGKTNGDDIADSPQCFDIEGKLAIEQGTDAPGDLRMTFSGAETVGHGGKVRVVDDVAVYRLKDGKYVLVEGRNPVPGF